MSIIPVSVVPITPLASYVAPYPSIGNITPFTYRDGTTYLEVLYNLQDYINSTVIPFINATIGMPSSDFQTQVNVLITTINANILAEETRVNTALASQTTANNTAITNLTNYVNAQVASIVGSSISVQDSGISTLVNTPASLTTVALKALYANKTTETDVSTGRLTDVNLQAEFALKSVETIVTAGRLSDVNLKTEFAGKAYETTIDSLGTVVSTGRLSDTALQTEFVTKNLINTAQLPTIASLSTVNPLYAGRKESITNLFGCFFQYNGTTWDMVGTPYVNNFAAIATIIPTPNVGWTVQALNERFTRKWNGTSWKPYGASSFPIIPASASAISGTAVIGNDGAINFTNATTILINSCFTSFFTNYIIEMEVTNSSAGSTIGMQLSVNSVASNSSNYNYETITAAGSVASASTSGAVASWFPQNPGGITNGIFQIELGSPFLVSQTSYRCKSNLQTSANTSSEITYSGWNVSVNSYDGILITPNSGNITGKIVIFGKNSN